MTHSTARHERWLSDRTCRVLRIDGDLSVAERTARVLAALAADEPESSARP